MRVSRSDRGTGGALFRALVLVAGLLPGPAAGQQLGPPIPLVPQPPPDAGRDAPIAGEPLSEPAPDWGGHMAGPADPLAADFWQGTPRALAELLLSHLTDTTSPALQALERRLLLSPGAAPQGPDADGASLPALRAAALLRRGELDAARAVVAALHEPQRGAALPLAVAADAAAGDTDRACRVVRDRIREDQGTYWQEALIACQALQGEADKARLGMQLLAEQKVARDEALTIVIEGPLTASAVTHLREVDPLSLRLLVASRHRLAPALIETLRPDLALTLARDEAAPMPTRILAAERAARFGALAPKALGELYRNSASPEAGAKDDPALVRARRFAAIANADETGDRLARILAFAEAFGGEPGGRLLAARLVAPALRDIAPDPALAASSAAAARLLLGAGDAAAARRWVALAPDQDLAGLRVLLRLATPGKSATAESASAEPAAAPIDPTHQAIAATLLAALGEPLAAARLPTAAWTATGRPAVATAPWLDLAAAAAAKRVGETVLAAALVAAPDGNLTPDPVLLAAAVSGLVRVGCSAEAHRLAVEAALAAGL